MAAAGRRGNGFPDYVGTEHILVGLMQEGTGTAARVLEAGDVKLERVLELEKKLVSSSQPTQIRDREGLYAHCQEGAGKQLQGGGPLSGPAHRNGAYPYGHAKADGLCGSAAFKYIGRQHPEALYRTFCSAPWEKKEPPAVRSWSRAGAGRDGKADTPVLDELQPGSYKAGQQRESWIQSSEESMRSAG